MLQILSHSPRLLAAACWVSCVSRISSEEKRAEMPQSVLQCFSREHAEELSKLHTVETIFGSPRPDRHDITLPWIAELSAETRKIYCIFFCYSSPLIRDESHPHFCWSRQAICTEHSKSEWHTARRTSRMICRNAAQELGVLLNLPTEIAHTRSPWSALFIFLEQKKAKCRISSWNQQCEHGASELCVSLAWSSRLAHMKYKQQATFRWDAQLLQPHGTAWALELDELIQLVVIRGNNACTHSSTTPGEQRATASELKCW